MSKKQNRRKFIVTVDVPSGVSLSEMEDYIKEAVAAWKGSFDPDSALFYLDGTSVKAKNIPTPRKP